MAEMDEIDLERSSKRFQQQLLSSPSTPVDISSFTYTPCYCEENVYFLCKQLGMNGVADPKGNDLFVVFISNEQKTVPLWHQKASERPDGLVIWDYHVICVQLRPRLDGNANGLVWDLDTNLAFTCSLKQYIGEAIRSIPSLISTYERLFRVIHAPHFLRSFASDRSHMKDSHGNWTSPPPPYVPIVAEDGTTNNFDEYLKMHRTDTVLDIEALVVNIFSDKFGVVLPQSLLDKFFDKIPASGLPLMPLPSS